MCCSSIASFITSDSYSASCNQLDSAVVPVSFFVAVSVLVLSFHPCALLDPSSVFYLLFFLSLGKKKCSDIKIKRGVFLPSRIISYGDRGYRQGCVAGRGKALLGGKVR